MNATCKHHRAEAPLPQHMLNRVFPSQLYSTRSTPFSSPIFSFAGGLTLAFRSAHLPPVLPLLALAPAHRAPHRAPKEAHKKLKKEKKLQDENQQRPTGSQLPSPVWWSRPEMLTVPSRSTSAMASPAFVWRLARFFASGRDTFASSAGRDTLGSGVGMGTSSAFCSLSEGGWSSPTRSASAVVPVDLNSLRVVPRRSLVLVALEVCPVFTTVTMFRAALSRTTSLFTYCSRANSVMGIGCAGLREG